MQGGCPASAPYPAVSDAAMVSLPARRTLVPCASKRHRGPLFALPRAESGRVDQITSIFARRIERAGLGAK